MPGHQLEDAFPARLHDREHRSRRVRRNPVYLEQFRCGACLQKVPKGNRLLTQLHLVTDVGQQLLDPFRTRACRIVLGVHGQRQLVLGGVEGVSCRHTSTLILERSVVKRSNIDISSTPAAEPTPTAPPKSKPESAKPASEL